MAKSACITHLLSAFDKEVVSTKVMLFEYSDHFAESPHNVGEFQDIDPEIVISQENVRLGGETSHGNNHIWLKFFPSLL